MINLDGAFRTATTHTSVARVPRDHWKSHIKNVACRLHRELPSTNGAVTQASRRLGSVRSHPENGVSWHQRIEARWSVDQPPRQEHLHGRGPADR